MEVSRYTVTIDKDLKEKAFEIAKRERRSFNSLVCIAVEEYVRKQNESK